MEKLHNIRYIGNSSGRTGLWEFESEIPVALQTTTTTGARRVLRRLAITTTCADLDAYGIDLAFYFNTKQYTPAMIAALIVDSKAEYAAAIAATNGSVANVRAANSSITGFLNADISKSGLAGADDAAKQQAGATALRTAADEAATIKLYKGYARTIMEKKYETA